MKYNLFLSLATTSQKECFSKLPFTQQSALLNQIKNMSLLTALFKQLPALHQKDFLLRTERQQGEAVDRVPHGQRPTELVKLRVLYAPR